VAGVSVPANSIYISVVGGTDLDVAQAILSKKAPGCGYGGNTTVTAYDSNQLYSNPIPYQVTFERPAALQILFSVVLFNNATIPSNAAALIQAAIINAFAGGDGKERARVGTVLLASRFIAPVEALGAWAQIRTLTIGSNNTPVATFTGSIAGTTLTTSAPSGVIAIGQTVSDAAGVVAVGTVITGGSGSSWTVSVSQTVTSRAMFGTLPNQSAVSVNASQVPEVAADNIAVTAT
jgi:hypothetical protein